MPRFCCPTCGHRDRVPETDAERQVICVKCGRRLDLTDPSMLLPPLRSDKLDATAKRVVDRPRAAANEQSLPRSDKREEDRVSHEDARRRRKRYCFACGTLIRWREHACPECDTEQPPLPRRRRADPYDDAGLDRRSLQEANSKKIVAGLCAIFLGTLGIHKFVLGFPLPGVVYLLLTIGTCGFAALILWVFAVAEGAIYLSKNDRDFYETYILDRKQWF